MPREGWKSVEFTASEELVKFLDGWKSKNSLESRADAVRDLLEWARSRIDDPSLREVLPATKQDVLALRNEIRALSGLPRKKD